MKVLYLHYTISEYVRRHNGEFVGMMVAGFQQGASICYNTSNWHLNSRG